MQGQSRELHCSGGASNGMAGRGVEARCKGMAEQGNAKHGGAWNGNGEASNSNGMARLRTDLHRTTMKKRKERGYL